MAFSKVELEHEALTAADDSDSLLATRRRKPVRSPGARALGFNENRLSRYADESTCARSVEKPRLCGAFP